MKLALSLLLLAATALATRESTNSDFSHLNMSPYENESQNNSERDFQLAIQQILLGLSKCSKLLHYFIAHFPSKLLEYIQYRVTHHVV